MFDKSVAKIVNEDIIGDVAPVSCKLENSR